MTPSWIDSMGPSLRGAVCRLIPAAVAGVVLAMPAAPPGAYAATIRVPEDKPTLRAAVQAAASGDVILFAPGTYAGGAFVDHKRLNLASWYLLGGDTSYVSRTVLTGVASGVCAGAPGCAGNAVLEFGPDATDSQIFGLTLTGGENGVASTSKVSIIACHIVGNGDGVDYVSGAGGTFSKSLFANNSDDGIDLNGDMDLTIADNDIRDNGDDGIEYRLFAYTGPMRSVTVTGNRISGNAEDGIQLIDYSSVDSLMVRIERNLFMANFDASGSSAAIGCMANGNSVENLSGAAVAERVWVIHNTFMGEKNGLVGGANTIAIDNVFTGIENRAVRRVGGASVVAYSLFWNNGVHYESSVLDSPTVRVVDPRVDAAGRLMAGSPAIDTGPRSYAWQGETVLSEPSAKPPDIGAFEYVANRPPRVRLGPDRLVRLPATIRLSGAVSDDGQPVPEGMLTYQWSVVSGPAPVTIDSPITPYTGATFPVVGTYRIRLAAFDGELTGADTLDVTVLRLIGIGDFPVAARADDAEEQSNGVLSPNVMAIDLVSGQTVGLRFPHIALSPGATITAAYVQFVAGGVQSDPTSLVIQGQAADNPDTFAVHLHEITGRPRTAAAAVWTPPPWSVFGEAASAERSADLAPVIQEIISRPGWASGNAIVLIVSGSGRRTAKSFDGDPAGAAVLHVEAMPAVLDAGEGPPVGLELRRAGGAIGRGTLALEFGLPEARPATLEVLDLAGRRLVAREVGGMGAGRHRVELAQGLRAGVYFVRLTQGAHTRMLKAAVLN